MFNSSSKKSAVTQWPVISFNFDLFEKTNKQDSDLKKKGLIFWEVSFLESKSQRKQDIRVLWKPVNINNNEKSFYPTTKLNWKFKATLQILASELLWRSGINMYVRIVMNLKCRRDNTI